MSVPQTPMEVYLVVGGSGFLGSHIVEALLERGEKHIMSFSKSKPAEMDKFEGVSYFTGDLGDSRTFRDCLKATSPSVVFHTVSPSVKNLGLPETEYYRVNVEATKTILVECQNAGVRVFVYTSSTAAVWSGQQVSGKTEEEMPIPEKIYAPYGHSKGLAEKLVLSQNGHKRTKTVVLRPPGMVGPRDRLSMWRLVQTYKSGQHKIRMGNNTNLASYSYVGNIADAHILAADKICEALDFPSHEDPVSGEAFFVNDGVPRPYWDFPARVWKHLGDDGKGTTTLPRWLCFVLAFISEMWCKLFGGIPRLPMFLVDLATREQWYSIEKAKRLLGYQPRVSFEDGLHLMLTWWDEQGAQQHARKIEESRKRK